MTYQDRMSSTPYFDRYKEYEPDEPKVALKIGRRKIVIELEIDTDITNYDSHQVVLTHPEMDGSLTFDVSDLRDAEDRLESLDFEMRDEMPAPPKKVEPVKPYTPPQSYATSQPYVPPVRTPPPQPSVPDVKISIPKEDANQDLNQNPVGSMIGDVIEICQLFGKMRPKVKNINDSLKKR